MPTHVNRLSSLPRGSKVFLQVGVDALLIIFSFVTAMTLRLDSLTFVSDPAIWSTAAVTVPVSLFAFGVLGLYSTLVRFITGTILFSIAKGVIASAAALFLTGEILDAGVPRSVPLIYTIMLFLAVGAVRFAARHFFRQSLVTKKTPAIIYGAGEAGLQLLNSLYHGRDYQPVAFVDDDPLLHGLSLGGLTVHSPHKTQNLALKTGVRIVLLAIPSLTRTRRHEIIRELQSFGLEIKTIPGIDDIISGRAKVSELRQVEPEDLLGRDPVAPDQDLLRRNITAKVVMVSGAGGSIGSELCRQILALQPTVLVLYEISEFALYTIDNELQEIAKQTNSNARIVAVLGSVQDAVRVGETISRYKVKTIYHAAAYKHVPLLENNVIESIKNNVFGTLTLSSAAKAHGVESFILISTDKAVRPTNVMGATKRIAELICQAHALEQTTTIFSMVRFGNVLGSSGSVIPRFKMQIESGGPVTVTHRDVTRYFMTIPEASQLVIQAGSMATGGDVFILEMGKAVNILDLALEMIRLHGLIPYVSDNGGQDTPANGYMPVIITGLRKGEKLYEELLIGNSPTQTAHPRIMSAKELHMSLSEIKPFLSRMEAAVNMLDSSGVKTVLEQMPIDYSPTKHSYLAGHSALEERTISAAGTDVLAPGFPSTPHIIAHQSQ